MQSTEFHINGKVVPCYFDGAFDGMRELCPGTRTILLTDENLYRFYEEKFHDFEVIRMTPGEDSKNQTEADRILNILIETEADRNVMLIGVGGGVVTDMAGYVASVFKRGIRLGLVPTSILGMVDAAIGGKNGINSGLYKNIVGTIHQPEFILFDYSFLKTLPGDEWINGFSEIIKHACIRDRNMFRMLEKYNLHDFQSDLSLTAAMIETNVRLKMAIVTADERDTDLRLLLNFGHSIGHAVENLNGIPHGHAISVGMVSACALSEKILGFPFEEGKSVIHLLARYHLTVDLETDLEKVFELMKRDKKREGDHIRFVLLESIGKGVVHPVGMELIRENLSAVL